MQMLTEEIQNAALRQARSQNRIRPDPDFYPSRLLQTGTERNPSARYITAFLNFYFLLEGAYAKRVVIGGTYK